jgi:hypothetical protein
LIAERRAAGGGCDRLSGAAVDRGDQRRQGPRLGHAPSIPADLDSQFRYVSGIFLGLGLAFFTCVPAIERKGARFRLLGALVIAGGMARALSWAMVGAPSTGHRLGLAMELGVVPLLMLWQARVARRRR